MVPTVFYLSKNTIYQINHQRFGNVSIARLNRMGRTLLMKGLPKYIPDLEDTCPTCLLNKATKNPRGPTIDVSKPPSGFMLQIDFTFFNVERIRVFNSNFVAICYDTSYQLGLTYRSNRLPIGTIKFIVTKLRNYDKKFAFI